MNAGADIPVRRGLTARGRRTRENLVSTAGRLMHRFGVRATSVDDVLSGCNAGKSQFYQHFSSKDELLQAVIARHWADTRAAFDLDNPGPDTWPAVRRWVDTVGTMQVPDCPPARCPLGSIANELSGTSEAVRRQLDQIFDEWAAHLAAGLAVMRQRGLLEPSADPTRLATTTLATIQGGLILSHTRGDLDPLNAALDGAYALLNSYATASGDRQRTSRPSRRA